MRSMHDISEWVFPHVNLTPQTISTITTTNGTTVNRLAAGFVGFESALAVYSMRTLTGTGSPNLQVTIQNSADGGSTWTTVNDRDGNPATRNHVAAANDQTFALDMSTMAGQFRFSIASLGATISSELDAYFLLAGERYTSTF